MSSLDLFQIQPGAAEQGQIVSKQKDQLIYLLSDRDLDSSLIYESHVIWK